jgi:predicted RNA binding protein YcfA (HicA-like mRNA interferase family)
MMSVSRRDLVKHLEQHGFSLLREGGNHSNGERMVKRHRDFDRITANQICKQAGVPVKI